MFNVIFFALILFMLLHNLPNFFCKKEISDYKMSQYYNNVNIIIFRPCTTIKPSCKTKAETSCKQFHPKIITDGYQYSVTFVVPPRGALT